jgi:hypothetical protein
MPAGLNRASSALLDSPVKPGNDGFDDGHGIQQAWNSMELCASGKGESKVKIFIIKKSTDLSKKKTSFWNENGRRSVLITALLIWGLQGCATALHPGAFTGLIFHTRGANQHTATVQLALPPGEVYAGMLRVAARHSEFRVANKVQSRFLLEVEDGTRRLTGQATDLGEGKTLLFMWADAGGSGQTGQALLLEAVKEICAELAVQCEMGKK